jgi:hypothetical protein
MAWQYRAGKFIWKHRKKVTKAVRVDQLRKRALKYRKKLMKPKSKGKSSIATASGRTAKRRKTMRAPSALKGKPKFVRYRKGGCPPGYVYDVKRKMCIQNT